MPTPPISHGPAWYPPPQQYVPYPVVVAPPPTSGYAIASLTFALIGFFGGWCLFGIPPALAVVFGHLATPETKRGERGGHGMAVTGLILGYVVLIPTLVFGAVLSYGLATTDWDTITNYPTPGP